MKFSILSLAFASVFAVLSAAPAKAEVWYPWCAQYGGGHQGISAVVCSFVSFGQCQATVRGLGGFCIENSYPPPPPPYRVRRRL
jgi:hypothetical protein